MLEIKNLNVAYGDTQVIWDLNLNVKEGEIVTMLGPRFRLYSQPDGRTALSCCRSAWPDHR